MILLCTHEAKTPANEVRPANQGATQHLRHRVQLQVPEPVGGRVDVHQVPYRLNKGLEGRAKSQGAACVGAFHQRGELDLELPRHADTFHVASLGGEDGQSGF